jgi:prevent-host-death family protein
MKTVGVYEAKTHFAKLLAAVERGECVTITRHGKPIAQLGPVPSAHKMSMAEIIEGFRRIREAQPPLDVPIKDLINEGRRF